MTTLKMWTCVCAAFLLVATLVSGTAVAQDPKGQDPNVQDPNVQTPKAQDAKMIEGILMDIDQTARILTLKAADNEMQFSYTDQTELVAPDNDGKPPVVKQGTKMRVHYMERDNGKIATKIEIM